MTSEEITQLAATLEPQGFERSVIVELSYTDHRGKRVVARLCRLAFAHVKKKIDIEHGRPRPNRDAMLRAAGWHVERYGTDRQVGPGATNGRGLEALRSRVLRRS